MDSDELVTLLNKFDDLKPEYLNKAIEIVNEAGSVEATLMIIANMLNLIYVGKNAQHTGTPQTGFSSFTKG